MRCHRDQFLFKRGPPPTVEVEGGLEATDIYVSSDQTKVYFTLFKTGAVASEGNANITITDFSGTVVKLNSNNPDDAPSPWLKFEIATSRALAGLKASLENIAVDSCFDSIADSPDHVLNSFYHRFTPMSDIYDEIVSRTFDRIG